MEEGRGELCVRMYASIGVIRLGERMEDRLYSTPSSSRVWSVRTRAVVLLEGILPRMW